MTSILDLAREQVRLNVRRELASELLDVGKEWLDIASTLVDVEMRRQAVITANVYGDLALALTNGFPLPSPVKRSIQ